MRRNRQSVSVTIDREVLSTVDEIAVELDETRSRIIEDCIKSGHEDVLFMGRVWSGKHEDPMYRWVGQTLREMERVPPEERTAVWEQRVDDWVSGHWGDER